MSGRRTVAWAEIESPQARMWRQVATGVVTSADLRGRRRKTGRYWCGADHPFTNNSFLVSPVYNVSIVPENAECEECGIGIRELQRMLT